MELPEEDELVLIQIKKILPYGAFCILPEYNNAEAFLHISEVAPRWIKNIHEFISEGQRHVAKVYRIDKEKNQIDLSLKRVSEEEKKNKLLVSKQEKRAEKLLELALAQSKGKVKPEDVRKKLEEHFGTVYDAFQQSSENDKILDEVTLPAAIKERIVEVAQKNIKRPMVGVSRILSITCYQPDGIEIIKKLLSTEDKKLKIRYLGAPRYQLLLTAKSYKEGERQLSHVVEDIKSLSEKHKCDTKVEE
ncbi:MAG TPA: S1 RNA-binding domain-containing protein [Candidatus Bilamarchaeaceae archaeon]|nr:S1 RNA-binding domain-containing protein [Candidatus Bilamarchaeaceae archaeon]